MWSKARYRLGVQNGRHIVGLITEHGTEWLRDPYPPEAETAERVEWTPELIAEWRNLARKEGQHPVWYDGEPPRGPAGGWIMM